MFSLILSSDNASTRLSKLTIRFNTFHLAFLSSFKQMENKKTMHDLVKPLIADKIITVTSGTCMSAIPPILINLDKQNKNLSKF